MLSEAGTQRGRSLPKGFAHIQGRQTLLASSHPNPRKDTNHKSNGLSPFPEEKSLSSPNMGPPLSAPTSPAFCVQSALAPPLLVQWRIYAAPELHTHTHTKGRENWEVPLQSLSEKGENVKRPWKVVASLLAEKKKWRMLLLSLPTEPVAHKQIPFLQRQTLHKDRLNTG